MTASSLSVTPGSGLRLATNSYTEGAVTVHDQKAIIGEPYLPEYRILAASVSTATLDSHVLQIMAGASLNLYVRRIRVYQGTLATTAVLARFDIARLTTAGTGGTALTPAPFDTTDAAAGATGMTLPTVKGTEGTVVELATGYFAQTILATAVPNQALLYDWDFGGLRQKAIRIPAGAANGLAVKNRTAVAGAAVMVVIEFTEASF